MILSKRILLTLIKNVNQAPAFPILSYIKRTIETRPLNVLQTNMRYSFRDEFQATVFMAAVLQE